VAILDEAGLRAGKKGSKRRRSPNPNDQPVLKQ